MTPALQRRNVWRAALSLVFSGESGFLARKLFARQLPQSGTLQPKLRSAGLHLRPPLRAEPLILMGGPSLARDGAPLSQSEIALNLKKRGFDVRIVTARDGPLRAMYEAVGIEVDLVQALQSSPSVPDWYEADVIGLADYIRHQAPDLVFASTIDAFALIDAARVAGVRTIWNIRESEPWRERLADRHPSIAARLLACLGYAERLIFVAQASLDVWGVFTTPDRLIKIYNAASLEGTQDLISERAHIRSALGVAEHEVLIASIGTLCPRKGQLSLADALNKLEPETLEKIRVIIVGRSVDDYGKRFSRRLSRLASARCNMMGEREDAALLIAAADILVNTSVSEAFPRTFLEAAARKTAIIASDVDGAGERLRHNRSARLFPLGNSERLAAEIQSLVLDSGARKTLADRAFDDLVANWTQDEMVSAYEKAIRDTIRWGEAKS